MSAINHPEDELLRMEHRALKAEERARDLEIQRKIEIERAEHWAEQDRIKHNLNSAEYADERDELWRKLEAERAESRALAERVKELEVVKESNEVLVRGLLEDSGAEIAEHQRLAERVKELEGARNARIDAELERIESGFEAENRKLREALEELARWPSSPSVRDFAAQALWPSPSPTPAPEDE